MTRLWRLARTGQTALDGAGTLKHGGRYSPPGAPVVNFASEAGLAVLIALRYLPGDPADAPEDYVLGWTEIDSVPERATGADDDAILGRRLVVSATLNGAEGDRLIRLQRPRGRHASRLSRTRRAAAGRR